MTHADCNDFNQRECGPDCADFIIGLMTVDQEQRMTCATARQHAWMGGNFASRDRASRKSKRKEKLTPAVVSKLFFFFADSRTLDGAPTPLVSSVEVALYVVE